MRPEKQLLLNEIREKIDASSAMIVTRYQQLEPNASWALRHLLSKQGSLFEAVNKRMFLKALEQAGIEVDVSHFEGHIGVVFVSDQDAMSPIKTVFQFSTEHGDLFKVICGYLEGRLVPGLEVEMLSKLPSLDEMRAHFIALLVAPMSQLLAVMEAVMAEPLSVLEQKQS